MLKKLMRIYFLFFGLHVLGVTVAGYNFTISTIAAILIGLYALINKVSLNKRTLLLITLFSLWAFFSTAFRFGIGTYVLSLGTLVFMTVPILLTYKHEYFEDISKYIYLGLLLVLPFVFYDLGVTVINLPPLESVFGVFAKSKSTVIIGFYRVKGPFDEPSYLGIYLCTLLYYFLNTRTAYSRKAVIIIACVIPFTLSLTAYILAFIITSLHTINSMKKLILVYSLIIFALLSVPIVGDLILERVSLTIESVVNSNYSGSEGSRANSLFVLLKYFSEASYIELLTGEGYGRYDLWLIEKFGHLNSAMVSFARGHINNAVAVVGISNGLIGLALYISIFLVMYADKTLTFRALFIHLLIQFSYAFVVGYMFWGILLLLKLASRKHASEQTYKLVPVNE